MLIVLTGWVDSASARSGEASNSGSAEGDGSSKELRQRLRTLEAKYKETGEAKYMFRRVLTLEEMGEYEFALDVLEEHRGEFESSDEVDGIAVVEQRLRDATDGSATSSAGGSSTGKSGRGTRGPDPVTWALIGGGGAVALGSIVPFAVAETRAKRLRCSPFAAGPSADGCDGVDAYQGLTKSEFDQKSSSVTTFRVLGVGLAVVGAGAAGYGIYRLVTGRPRSTGDRAAGGLGPVRISGAISRRGGGLRLHVDF